jgi:hypothetical protein
MKLPRLVDRKSSTERERLLSIRSGRSNYSCILFSSRSPLEKYLIRTRLRCEFEHGKDNATVLSESSA